MGVLHALRSEDRPTPMTLQIISAIAPGKTLDVTFSASGQTPAQGADIRAVIADDVTTSNVLRGENSDRTLSHVSVARTMTRVTILKTATTMTVNLPMPTAQNQATSGRHLILFAQTAG